MPSAAHILDDADRLDADTARRLIAR